MQLDLRYIERESRISPNSTADYLKFGGREFSFDAGSSLRNRFKFCLSRDPSQFLKLPRPERLLCALEHWSRVYRFPVGEHCEYYVLGVAGTEAPGEFEFYRIDLLDRKPNALRRILQITGGAILTRSQCGDWLVSHAERANAAGDLSWAREPGERLKNANIVWVGPEMAEGQSMLSRLRARGAVFGAKFRREDPAQTTALRWHLASKKDLDYIILWKGKVPYLDISLVPDWARDRVYICEEQRADEHLAGIVRLLAELWNAPSAMTEYITI